jgi:probable HAF family extracellular repeat protein
MLLLAGLGGTTCAPPPRALPSPVAELAAVERTFDFRTIEVRAARRTTASGINEGGLIVGYFEDSVGTHAFVLRDSSFTTIDFPAAAFTVGWASARAGRLSGRTGCRTSPR